MSKKLFILPAILLGAVLVLTNTSCKDCKIDQNDFTGQYNVSEDCSASQPASYNVTISAGASETDIKITNFWGEFKNAVNATIDCEVITIPRQQPDNDKFFVEGSGILEKNKSTVTINMTYKVTDETGTTIQTDNCTSTVYTKL